MDNDYKDMPGGPIIEKADGGSTDGSQAEGAPATGEKVEQVQLEPEFDPKASYTEMKQQLENMTRELGQSRSMQSKLDKLMARLEGQGSQTNQQQDVLSQLKPEERRNAEQLIEAIWKEKYGKEFEGLQEFKSSMEADRVSSSIDSAAKSFLGKEYEALEPVMAGIVQSAVAARDAGDTKAERFIAFLTESPEIGAQALAAMAQRQYASNLQGKSQQAIESQKARGANAAGSVAQGAGNRGSGKPDVSKMTIPELRAAAEAEALAG